MFTTFTGLAQGGEVSILRFVNIPVSIITGIIVGLVVGFIFVKWFLKIKIRATVKAIIVLSVSFALSAFEDNFKVVPFASLIAIMAIGIGIKKWSSHYAKELSGKYDKMWAVAEIFLFVLVGASVAIDSAVSAGVSSIILVLGVLLFRMLGVFVCVLGTKLNIKEKLFCIIAYTPKATVQAAIGGLPLAMGLPCGQIVLTVSVIAILLTAPMGAFGIDLTYQRFLKRNKEED